MNLKKKTVQHKSVKCKRHLIAYRVLFASVFVDISKGGVVVVVFLKQKNEQIHDKQMLPLYPI